jgi:hypothetical protein
LDRKFLSRFKDKKEALVILTVLALGLLLLFFGGADKSTEEVSSESLEERIASACSGVEGVGECSVYIHYSKSGSRDSADRVESVIVVCEGADSVGVRLRLTQMLSSFFGIGTNRVRIEKMRS